MKNYKNLLKEILTNKEIVTPERLQAFMGETMQCLHELRIKLTSKEVKEREEAKNECLELKEILEAQIGVDLLRLSEADLKGQIEENEQEAFASTREQFNELKRV